MTLGYKNWIKRVLSVVVILTVITFSASADVPPPPGGGSGGGPSGSDLPVGAPIDGGLGLLLAFGAAYGLKKMRKNN